MIAILPDAPAETGATHSRAGLLGHFYARLGLPLPRLHLIQGEDVPPPYQSLLVHSSDMTSRLERFYGRSVGLSVLKSEIQGEDYLREVILRAEPDGQPVEYGVIRICLNHFPPAARERVLKEQAPLGAILQSEAMPYLSWPQAFFCLESDPHTGAAFGLTRPCMLYGRRNVLLDAARRLLAEVIEVLAPIQ